FAMEYIEGSPLTSYCDRWKLDIRERLELFIRVCEGVQYAHSNNIAHRDLKPENVLVERQDERSRSSVLTSIDASSRIDLRKGPRPVIIDFGVAKDRAIATSGRGSTLTFELLGTADYMSPEQANPQGTLVDNRADVYTLGVMLYELVAGVRPFNFRKLQDSKDWPAIAHTLQETPPLPPSKRLATLATSDSALVETIARSRREEIASLGRILEAELERIPLKAMEKDPEDRYQTAIELAEDIRRHLDGFPIRAMPPTASYRLRKYVRRNKGAVAVSGAIALSAGLGVTGLVRAEISQANLMAAESDKKLTQVEADLSAERAKSLERQREALRSVLLGFFSADFERAADSGLVGVVLSAARGAAESWTRICARETPGPEDARGRADLVADLALLADTSLRAARASATTRARAVGAGDSGERTRWLQAADDSIRRIETIDPSASALRDLRIMRGRMALDELHERVGRSGFLETIAATEEFLRAHGSQSLEGVDPELRARAERDLGLVRTLCADSYARPFEVPGLDQRTRTVEDVRVDLDRMLVLRRAEVDRRRALVDATPVGEASQLRQDLAVALDRLSWSLEIAAGQGSAYAEPEALKLRSEAQASKLEYARRFLGSEAAAFPIRERQEYAGYQIRQALTALDGTKGQDEGAATQARTVAMEAIDAAIGVHARALWTDPSDLSAFHELLKIEQRFLGSYWAFPVHWRREMLDRIATVAVEPLREVAAEEWATPQIAHAIRATRLATDSRRALLWASDLAGRGHADATAPAARALAEASRVIDAWTAGDAGGGLKESQRASLMMEVDLAVLVAECHGIDGAADARDGLAALRARPALQKAFEDRNEPEFEWTRVDLARLRQLLGR
ncbi:MAG: serine/threonine-protein kinase, partial [Planctomycetota bacterium]